MWVSCLHYSKYNLDFFDLQVQTALKRALQNKMVKLNRHKKYTFSGPIVSKVQNKKCMVYKSKKLRFRKCKKKRIRNMYKITVRKAGNKQSSGINKSSHAIHRISRRTSKFIENPESCKFVLLDWLKLTWSKFRRNFSFT